LNSSSPVMLVVSLAIDLTSEIASLLGARRLLNLPIMQFGKGYVNTVSFFFTLYGTSVVALALSRQRSTSLLVF
jgi:hypothetical protein